MGMNNDYGIRWLVGKRIRNLLKRLENFLFGVRDYLPSVIIDPPKKKVCLKKYHTLPGRRF